MRTYKNECPVCILLATIDHLIDFVLCNVGVDGVERPCAISKIGHEFFRRCPQRLIWCRPILVAVAIYYGTDISKISRVRSKSTGNTCLCRRFPRDLRATLQ